MSKLFKPILPKSDELCLTSTVLEIPTNKHPLIICYDGGINYYYLKCRSAINRFNKLKTKHFNEVLIHKNTDNPNKVLYKDIYVDTSHIFMINQGDLEKLLINNENMFIWGDELKLDDIQNIGLKMYENLTVIPPLMSITETIVEDDNINFKTLYCNIEKSQYELSNIKSNLDNSIKLGDKKLINILKQQYDYSLSIIDNLENLNQDNYWLVNNIKSIAQELAISPKNILEL